MDLGHWPHLDELVREAARLPALDVWLFGSAARGEGSPADLDVLLVYTDRRDVVALRGARSWEDFDPPCHLIAMTPLEVYEYDFVNATGAVRVSGAYANLPE